MRFMRRSKRPTEVCQNCLYSDNDLGKWKHTWKRRSLGIGIDENDNLIKIPKQGYWHILCIKKGKYHPWDLRKRCFTK